jgi:hypothetical protein
MLALQHLVVMLPKLHLLLLLKTTWNGFYLVRLAAAFCNLCMYMYRQSLTAFALASAILNL